MSSTSPDLIARCLAGEEQAWYQLVGQHAPLVYAIARRAGLPEHACDDLAQQVFAALSANLSRIRDEAALPAWLITTAKRDAWRAVRAHRRSGSTLASEPAAEPDTIDLERHAELRRAMARLDDPCRELLHALYFGSSTNYEQISRQLNMPIGSIGPRRQRCLAKLETLLRPGDPGNEIP